LEPLLDRSDVLSEDDIDCVINSHILVNQFVLDIVDCQPCITGHCSLKQHPSRQCICNANIISHCSGRIRGGDARHQAYVFCSHGFELPLPSESSFTGTPSRIAIESVPLS
jgi:hypothetical protein